MNGTTEYKDKLFSILGDSISTLDGYSIPDYAAYYEGYKKIETEVFSPEYTWWGQVIEYLGGKLLVNNSFAGSMVSLPRGCEIESYGCSDERTSSLDKCGVYPDVIMVFMGTNDWGGGKQLFSDPNCPEDISVFKDAYKSMLKKLSGNYPHSEIWCFTLPLNQGADALLFDLPHNKKRPDIQEYCQIICKSAIEHGCRIIDLNKAVKGFETIDGFHPTAKGMKAISDGVILQIQSTNNL